MRALLSTALCAATLALAVPASAAETPEFKLVIKNHRFEPSELAVPAGRKLKLIVDNQDPTPEEFESHSLRREKVIKGGSKASIYVGPLEPGTYDFFGEYHESTAKGRIVAR